MKKVFSYVLSVSILCMVSFGLVSCTNFLDGSILKSQLDSEVTAASKGVLSVDAVSPSNEPGGVCKDSVITVFFKKAVNKNSFKDFSNIQIVDDFGTDVTGNYSSPEVSQDGLTLTIAPKENAWTALTAGSYRRVFITLKKSIKAQDGAVLGEDYKWSVILNSETDKEAPVITTVGLYNCNNKNSEINRFTIADLSVSENEEEFFDPKNYRTNKFAVELAGYDSQSQIKSVEVKEKVLYTVDGFDVSSNSNFPEKNCDPTKSDLKKSGKTVTFSGEYTLPDDTGSLNRDGIVQLTVVLTDTSGNTSSQSFIVIRDTKVNISGQAKFGEDAVKQFEAEDNNYGKLIPQEAQHYFSVGEKINDVYGYKDVYAKWGAKEYSEVVTSAPVVNMTYTDKSRIKDASEDNCSKVDDVSGWLYEFKKIDNTRDCLITATCSDSLGNEKPLEYKVYAPPVITKGIVECTVENIDATRHLKVFTDKTKNNGICNAYQIYLYENETLNLYNNDCLPVEDEYNIAFYLKATVPEQEKDVSFCYLSEKGECKESAYKYRHILTDPVLSDYVVNFAEIQEGEEVKTVTTSPVCTLTREENSQYYKLTIKVDKAALMNGEKAALNDGNERDYKFFTFIVRTNFLDATNPVNLYETICIPEDMTETSIYIPVDTMKEIFRCNIESKRTDKGLLVEGLGYSIDYFERPFFKTVYVELNCEADILPPTISGTPYRITDKENCVSLKFKPVDMPDSTIDNLLEDGKVPVKVYYGQSGVTRSTEEIQKLKSYEYNLTPDSEGNVCLPLGNIYCEMNSLGKPEFDYYVYLKDNPGNDSYTKYNFTLPEKQSKFAFNYTSSETLMSVAYNYVTYKSVIENLKTKTKSMLNEAGNVSFGLAGAEINTFYRSYYSADLITKPTNVYISDSTSFGSRLYFFSEKIQNLELKNLIEGKNGIIVFTEKPFYAHTVWSPVNLGDSAYDWEIFTTEEQKINGQVLTPLASVNYMKTYNVDVSSVEKGMYYCTVVYFADNTSMISEVRQKQ